jgi:hypothetical protein
MPTRPNRLPRLLRSLAGLALAFTFVSLAAPEASAQSQFGEWLRAHNRHFYGPLYDERGYADSLGLRGHARCENGGYYGPPQMYSRQWGRAHGYRLDPPFAPLRINQGVGPAGNDD